MDERERWDRAAGEYRRVFDLGLSDYNAALLRFWTERGMLWPGARVIDIGCGVGRYGTLFAELGCDVTLTDISDEMLRHAAENMARYRTPWTVYRCDFSEATGKEPVFEGGFDLAVCTMSPAVHDAATVRKMSGMSRGWCFLSRFSDWRQPFRDGLMRRIGMEPRRALNDPQADCEAMIAAVREAGFEPEVLYTDYNWSDRRTPEEMADYMMRFFFAEDGDADGIRERLLLAAREEADAAGTVDDAVFTEAAWIIWRPNA